MRKLIFSPEKCTGCRACELACSFSCDGVFSPSRSRIRVTKIDEKGIDIPSGCYHCDKAPCMEVCPVRAIYRDKRTNAVVVDVDMCIGCEVCITACPFGAINYDDQKKLVYKCDLCHGNPECVKWCFTGGIVYTDIANITREKRTREAMKFVATLTEIRRITVPGRE